MKKLLPFLCLVLISPIWLQAQVLADFETPETTPPFTAEGASGVVDNPDKSGLNPSDKVGYYHKISGNWHYVSLNFTQEVNIGYNNTLTFKLRCSKQGRIFAKFWNGNEVVIEDWAPEWAFQPTANTWVECQMDLTPAMQKKFTVLQLAACVDNLEEADVYFDDVELSNPDLGDGSPKILFTVSKNNVLVGETISFDATESYDYDGTITNYHWDFGDGATTDGVMVTHAYSSDSIYHPMLTITDNDNKTNSASTTIFVFDASQKLSKISLVSASPSTNSKIEGIFQINSNYSNVYDPDEVMADAEITKPDGSKITIPCFYFVKARLENATWVTDSGYQAWMFRFITDQSGIHQVVVKVTDADGVSTSDVTEIMVQESPSKGIIQNDANNHQYYRHTTGEVFSPMGINIGWNSMPNYIKTIRNLSESKANIYRYWHTPFAQQALEWKKTSFYGGLGFYSQMAAAMTDSLLNLGEELDVYMQLAIFQHGMFSENVNEMWADNPYNVVNGGYVARAEEYFYNTDCKKQTKKLLRYIVARWAYSRNIFAWEFFNEVQFTGIHNSQTSLWYPGVLTWHSEMSRYVAAIDPFNHIQTTSAEHNQLYDMDTIQNLDVVQYHLYADNLLTDQVNLDFQFRENLTRAAIINGEYGTNNEADVPMDMQRNAIWNGIMTQVPRYMWIWEHYLETAWTYLFTMPMDYLSEEDFGAKTNIENYSYTVNHDSKNIETLGITDGTNFYGYFYDPTYSNSVEGAVCELKDIPFANYQISYYLPMSGEVIRTETVPLIRLTHKLELPAFSKGMAFKIKYVSDYELPIAIAGNDTIVAPGMTVSFSGYLSVSQISSTLTFDWALVEKPATSQTAIENPTHQDISVTPDVAGIYKVSLTVNDGQNNSVPDVVTLTVSNPPVAVLPSDTTVTKESKYYYCDGSASYDVDGDALTYAWELVSYPEGSKAQLYQMNEPVSLLRLDVVGEFVLKLTVSDGVSLSEPKTIKIQVVLTDIQEQDFLSGVTLFPNPNNGSFVVNLPTGATLSLIEIYDISGREVQTEVLNKQESFSYTLNSQESPKGMYLVKMIINGKTLYRRLVIQ
ncbi:MAG TPA: hypothetical protein DCQ26_18540 [Marinilabiliales bacterium]|nr:MAG: hypothetical protein A2W84_02640 [Bacteroidetes bacterium GWC2_40_13]OFX75588.1 MAG: hypothetical protein A2W96_08880 [Bacteroidetes bacterium GWD2_40_43]OFX90694.1 MAG: hypothetical protein A2W97_02915 [Bacteroidetes bacterium GWE2_40_63]OFY20828.1 MAG: hypothetical protein A2W88_17350 [Bacteroidetes bacterium GWF2_40_13]OFZ23752.1 MAG: hypothetical protein A2437_06905 [Bacteroidetes bacterium RIFOXYC2_FULL_40_12]HAN00598.1 hypothetical protein [Marinilabiliales bacterium]